METPEDLVDTQKEDLVGVLKEVRKDSGGPYGPETPENGVVNGGPGGHPTEGRGEGPGEGGGPERGPLLVVSLEGDVEVHREKE